MKLSHISFPIISRMIELFRTYGENYNKNLLVAIVVHAGSIPCFLVICISSSELSNVPCPEIWFEK